ncbi:MAG: SMR family transporter [Gordonibacter sp.]
MALACSMLGLAYAVKTLPTGTAYAIWVGIGATLTVAYGMFVGTELVSSAKVLLISGPIGV